MALLRNRWQAELQDIADTILLVDIPLDNSVLTDVEGEDNDKDIADTILLVDIPLDNSVLTDVEGEDNDNDNSYGFDDICKNVHQIIYLLRIKIKWHQLIILASSE
ncbi:hypothetical protein QE152_g26778 [Popillia japonica]|uniref:Uncharacterized protein n=1 Tax=Popillia japonica TaxID=7064 RepID=A0AAW1JX93_POPJA